MYCICMSIYIYTHIYRHHKTMETHPHTHTRRRSAYALEQQLNKIHSTFLMNYRINQEKTKTRNCTNKKVHSSIWLITVSCWLLADRKFSGKNQQQQQQQLLLVLVLALSTINASKHKSSYLFMNCQWKLWIWSKAVGILWSSLCLWSSQHPLVNNI